MKARTHALFDYLGGIFLLIAPFLFGLTELPAARNNFWAVGLLTIGYTLFTRSSPAIARLLPFVLHRIFDALVGYWLMTVPSIFNYRAELSLTQNLLHVVVGVLWVGAAIFTRTPQEEVEAVNTTPQETSLQFRGFSPAWPIATIAASVAIAVWVILIGDRQPPVNQLSETRNQSGQSGPGAQARTAADATQAEQMLEVKSNPTMPAFYPEKLTVRAGSTNCIRFMNESVHNHADNLMVVQPGSEREVGLEAVNVGEEGDYIPNLPDKIIAHTETVPPGGSDTVCFKAPDKPGRYPYISTARNRWMAMKGVLIVERADKPVS